jgi:class 3 adenylate cyclase
VCDALEAAGISCWIAPRDVAPGAHYAGSIVAAIHAARAVVLVYSRAAGDSEHVERELDRAISAGLEVLPLRIEKLKPSGALEYFLAGRQWFDALSTPLEPHLERLCEALRGLLYDTECAAARRLTRAAGVPPLEAQAGSRWERRVVTILVFDVVGFTAIGESVDPDDVGRIPGEYSLRARKLIESHGGKIEKTVGDAVVGVFGVPAAHEDDAEIAVRTGLRLIESLEGEARADGSPLEAHVGVNTGEAVVRLDVDPASGCGFLTGDAVSTAARLKAAAPAGGVLVGALAHELSARAIDYEEVPPVTVRGSERLAAWLAKAPLPRQGVDVDRAKLTPLVDRDVELGFLQTLLAKIVAVRSPQFALLVGAPGVGKTRLVHELFASIDSPFRMITWRQGRCPSYGGGVPFWALSEIVKEQAGILETDRAESVEAKIDAAVPDGPDRAWMANRLRALLGHHSSLADRREAFTAWRRYLEALAGSHPTVVVFEDLHWADEPLLAFLDDVACHISEVPLFVVMTARPGLFEAFPWFAASGRVNRLMLGPLSRTDGQALVASLLGDRGAAIGRAIVERARGNPFYAEELVRLVGDRAGDAAHFADGETIPGSVRAVVAARLDALSADEKAALADASVVGEVFWDGALIEMGERSREDVDRILGELTARQVVHRMRSTSMADEQEYAFNHALVRDLVYGLLPPAERARKHAVAAAWLEGESSNSANDLAGILAHHYVTALDAARAAGQLQLEESLVEPAVRALSLAGERTMSLDVAAAERHYARAMGIVAETSPERPRVLVGWAQALDQLARSAEAETAFAEAASGFRAAGDARSAAVAEMGLAASVGSRDGARGRQLARAAVAVLEAGGPSPELVDALGCLAGMAWEEGDPRVAVKVAGRALTVAEQLGSPLPVRALALRGCGRCGLGDAHGIDDLRRALVAGQAAGLGDEVNDIFWTLAEELHEYEGTPASLQVNREAVACARRRGREAWARDHRTAMVWTLAHAGEWDAALSEAAELAPVLEASSERWDLIATRVYQAFILAWRGEAATAKPLAIWLEKIVGEDVGRIGEVCCSAAASVRLALGELDAARGLLGACRAALHRDGGFFWADDLPEAVRTAIAVGDRALARRLAEATAGRSPMPQLGCATARVLILECDGDRGAADMYADVATRWHDFGVPYEEGQALLGQGRCLVAPGRASEAAAPLAAAREIFTRLGAKPALSETNALVKQLAISS